MVGYLKHAVLSISSVLGQTEVQVASTGWVFFAEREELPMRTWVDGGITKNKEQEAQQA